MLLKSKKGQINWFIFILVLGVYIVVVLDSLKTTYDNDIWWLIATGREIIENGFPKYNPWSIHEGMQIVIQQWIPSVLLYLLYTVGKMPAVEIYVFILILAFTFLLYKMCRSCSDYRCGGEIIFAVIVIAIYPISTYFSCRPQIYSMAAYTAIIWLLELYRKTGRIGYLRWLPLITLIHVNFHASMVLFDLFIIGLYWIPNIPEIIKRKFGINFIEFENADYPRKPLFFVGILSAITTLVNPYGLKGALYLLESYGAAEYRDFIVEMLPAELYSLKGYSIIAMIALGCIVIGHKGNKKIHFPLTVLFIISIFLTIQRVRNIWFTPLLVLPLIADGIGELKINSNRFRFFKSKIVLILEIFILFDFVIIYGYANVWPSIVDYILISKTDDIVLPQKAADYMAEYAAENDLDKSSIKVLNYFNNGGLLEYYGYKVFMDARPELWEPPITGLEEHYYKEFVDLMLGDIEFTQIFEKYSFDFYIIGEGSLLEAYMQEHDDNYEVVEDCNGYNLWGNIKK